MTDNQSTARDGVELLPCPFCGGSNVKTYGPYGWYRQWCISHSCKAFYNGASDAMKDFPSEAEAIAAWNARALTTTPAQPDGWRPEVVAFANLMEQQLRANDHKPGWKGDDPEVLHRRLVEEASELEDAIYHTVDGVSFVANEAADVANFAMMIADVCGGLPAAPTPAVEEGR